MNVTKREGKYRQLHNASEEVFEDYPQILSAEQRGHAGVYASLRITENNIINTDLSTEILLEQILDRNNLNNAFKKVKSNKGAGGIDGMGVEHLLSFLKGNQRDLIQRIKDGKEGRNTQGRERESKKTRDTNSGGPGDTTGDSPSNVTDI